ncbi:hypothetical protein BV25DRAFT_1848543 [Artomyces pyxidatus]|uniref:Uncharacterized protein n=1 Tax=Artomyces pyxidatus TaxID=48021 RepID=A0ACB8TEZ3_9AGAM|nr:hypothetical protein BV25DRAFT_1848543 [Artomyces pyxidatus]
MVVGYLLVFGASLGLILQPSSLSSAHTISSSVSEMETETGDCGGEDAGDVGALDSGVVDTSNSGVAGGDAPSGLAHGPGTMMMGARPLREANTRARGRVAESGMREGVNPCLTGGSLGVRPMGAADSSPRRMSTWRCAHVVGRRRRGVCC